MVDPEALAEFEQRKAQKSSERENPNNKNSELKKLAAEAIAKTERLKMN